MNDMQNRNGPSAAEPSLEDLGRVAYMCLILNRAWTMRWYRQWRTALEQMAGKGWSWEGLHYRGRIRDKLEQIYGLTPRESRAAVAAYPRINLGIEPWQILTDSVADELTEKIYRAYVGLPAEHGRDYWTVPARNDGGDPRCEGCDFSYEADPSDSDEDNGGFYFL